MTDKPEAKPVTANSFLAEVRELAIECGVTLESIKFQTKDGLACHWYHWDEAGHGEPF